MKALSILLLLVSTNAHARNSFRAYILKNHDGDTLTIIQPTHGDECPAVLRLRLEGIDTPELSQPYGKQASRYVASAVYGRMFWISTQDNPDRYGRLIGRVCWSKTSPYKCLGYQLVRRGLAWHYKAYSKSKRLARAEARARKNKIGLWRQPEPVAPWDHRKKKRAKKGK